MQDARADVREIKPYVLKIQKWMDKKISLTFRDYKLPYSIICKNGNELWKNDRN